jgi:autotransporter-associated beta strand protein
MVDSNWAVGSPTTPTVDYNNPSNWANFTVPDGTARFAPGFAVNPYIAIDTTVGAWIVSGTQYVFSISSGSTQLTFTGAGISSVNFGTIAIANSGYIEFKNSSSAGASFITNQREMKFLGTSSAGTATITNNDYISFENSATAGSAKFSTYQQLSFRGGASAGSAQIIVESGLLSFSDLSNAGSASITNEDEVFFGYRSSAANAKIFNNDELAFGNDATAGAATIVNSAELTFAQRATAGSAVITTRSGGETRFQENSDGGLAQLITEAGGRVSFGTLGNSDGIWNVGSIAGNGSVYMGLGTLVVGANNLSTVAGLLEGSNGNLTKVGSGTLSLTAANTYTLHTKIDGGTLLVNGSTASASTTVNSGGTLGGHGLIKNSVVINNGGVLAPGSSAGNLTLGGGVEFKGGSILRAELGGDTVGTGYDRLTVAGAVSLGAPTLDLRLINSFSPSLTSQQSFIIIDNDGTDAVAGTFAGLAQGATVVAEGRLFTLSYTGGTGNDVVLTSGGAVRVGTEGDDILAGTAFADSIDGRGGLDVADYSFMTSAMKVTLRTGTQTVAGDTLVSIEGLFGGTGADEFKGTVKANLFRGGGGKDKLDGAGGLDTADYGDKTKSVQVTLDGSKTVTVKIKGKAEDTLKNIENVTGGSKADKLVGDSKANIFDGGLGKDILSGGGGKDKFVFSTALSAANVDTIAGFKTGQDKLVLDDAIFAAIGIKLDRVEFHSKDGTKAAKDGDDRIVYDSKSGKLYYDPDGLGGAAAVQFATLSGDPALSFKDFAIV